MNANHFVRLLPLFFVLLAVKAVSQEPDWTWEWKYPIPHGELILDIHMVDTATDGQSGCFVSRSI